jgi:hypothetical protein
MTKLTFQIEKPEDLHLLLSLAERLQIPYSQSDEQAVPAGSVAESAVQYILAYKNDVPSFGDGLEWQRREREERDLFPAL